MAMMRGWTAALLLLPTVLLVDRAAGAAEPTQTIAAGATLVSSVLPKGIHRTPTGRYVQDMCDHAKRRHCFSARLLPEGWSPGQPIPAKRGPEGGGGGGGGGQGMGAPDVAAAYNIPSNAQANGKIVAILDSPDSSALSDLAQYRSQYGLPPLPACAGKPTGSLPACFAAVSENGGPSSGSDGGGDADGETALDMDMVSAACPDCSILLVEIGDASGNYSDQDFVQGAQTAASLGAVATSISIGGPEEGNDPTGYTTPGHLVLAATGDFGFDLVDEGGNGPGYPASAPDVLAVGGTMLFNNGSSYDEAVWNDGSFGEGQNGQDITTSGCSAEYPVPSWQAAALSGSGCSGRATADVSAAATFASGGQETAINVYQGGWQSVEGTSASSPMVAGILTRLGLTDAISNNLGWVYTNASAWNDLGSAAYPADSQGSTTDSNDPSSCGKLCTVGTGWDGPSGVGTPNGAKLAALAGLPVQPPGMDAGSSSSSTGSSTGSGTSGSPGGGDDGGVSTLGSTTMNGSGLPLGSLCSASPACASGVCAAPSQGSLYACTESCGGTTSATLLCPLGFDCTSGYCFGSGDAGVDLVDPGSGGSSGCAVSSGSSGSGAGTLGWLAVGLATWVHRRRRRIS
jgi:MYXO-CTERM domain-containing protein